MSFRSKYGLTEMSVGGTKSFHGLTPAEMVKVKRSAHNYNLRTNAYFTTKLKDAVLYVTRLR